MMGTMQNVIGNNYSNETIRDQGTYITKPLNLYFLIEV